MDGVFELYAPLKSKADGEFFIDVGGNRREKVYLGNLCKEQTDDFKDSISIVGCIGWNGGRDTRSN
jgi:hypothetical protein